MRRLPMLLSLAVLLLLPGCGKDEHYHSLSSKGAIKKINNDSKK